MSEDKKALVVDGWPRCEICGRVLSLVDASYFSCAKHHEKRFVLLKNRKGEGRKNEKK